MGHEHYPLAVEIPEGAAVIPVVRVAGPAPDQTVERGHAQEAVQIQRSAQRGDSLRVILLLGGFDQGVQRGMVRRGLSEISRGWLVNVVGPAEIVKVAFQVVEVAPEKLFVPALGQDVKTKILPIEFDGGVVQSRRGHTGGGIEFAGDSVVEIGRVLDGIVQRDFLQAMKTLTFHELVEVQREAGLIVDRSKASIGAFKMDGDIRPDLVTFAHGGRDIAAGSFLAGAPRVLAQDLESVRGDLEAQMAHGGIGEQFVARRARHRLRRCDTEKKAGYWSPPARRG